MQFRPLKKIRKHKMAGSAGLCLTILSMSPAALGSDEVQNLQDSLSPQHKLKVAGDYNRVMAELSNPPDFDFGLKRKAQTAAKPEYKNTYQTQKTYSAGTPSSLNFSYADSKNREHRGRSQNTDFRSITPYKLLHQGKFLSRSPRRAWRAGYGGLSDGASRTDDCPTFIEYLSH